MVLDASLGDVVQEQRHVKQRAVPRQYRPHQLARQRDFGTVAVLDLVEHADAAQEVLVHRIVMIHVELHHRHNASERADELTEDAGLVHAAQHRFGLVLGGQDLQEQTIGLLVFAYIGIDQLEGAGGGTHRFRVNCEIVLLRQMEQPDQIDRIAFEYVGAGHIDAIVLDLEIVGLTERAAAARGPKPRDDPAEHRRGLCLLFLERSAKDGGEIADMLGGEEIVLHEAFDILQAGMLGVTEPHGDLALDVEGKTLLGAAAEEVHVAADRPQEILAAAKHVVFVAVEHFAIDQFLGFAHAIDVFCDPKQRVQIAQPAFAVFYVRLDQIARLAGAAMTFFALGELGGDELRRRSRHDFLVEPRRQFVVEAGVTEQVPRFQERGAYRHVGLGLADALADRARRVADLQPHVPQAIEQGFGDQFAPGGRLVGQHEEQIDVRPRRQQAAAIAAGGDHRHAFGLGVDSRWIKRLDDKLEQDAHDLILSLTQPFGAAPPVTVLEQQFLGARPRLGQCRFEAARDGGTEFALVPSVRCSKTVKVGDDGRAVEKFGGDARGALSIEHRQTS